MIPSSTNCICVFCCKNANTSKKSQTKLKELERDSFCIVNLDKVVNSATENSFMPLVQLSVVFPTMLYLFPRESLADTVSHTFDSLLDADLNINANSTLRDIYPTILKTSDVKTNMKLIITIISVITSFLSMAITLTSTWYLAKPARKSYMNVPRLMTYFLSIVLQVMPKLLTYQVFAFGCIGAIHPNLIIPSVILVPFILCIVRAIVFYHYIKKYRPDYIHPDKRMKASILFGLSTVYIYNEQLFYTKDIEIETGEKEYLDIPYKKVRKFYLHLVYDSFSFLENFCLAFAGGSYILDSNFNTSLFVIWIMGMHILGLVLKSSYYLFLHPWEGLNHSNKKLRRMFFIFTGLAIALYFFIIGYYNGSSMRTFIGTVSAMLFSILLIFGHGE